jgi:hypothetical protein
VSVCQFISGCRPIGEICLQPSDCCGGLCVEEGTTGVLRCEKPQGCMPEGEVCWEGQSTNCCPSGPSGGTALCLDTVLSLQRCWGEGTPDNCVADGGTCAFADECCGGFCLPDGSGGFVCAAMCVQLGDSCTFDADCCEAGLCVGGSCTPNTGDCLPIGNECTAPADCCSGVCEGGYCVGPA